MASITVYASKDASALESNDGWSGYDDHHPVGSNGSNKYCSFIYMPLSFTGWTGVTSAKLWVRGHRAGSGNHVLGAASGNTRTLTVRRMVSDWGEGTDRGETLWSSAETWGWSNRRFGSASISGGGSRVFTGYAEGTWYDIDVTDAVVQWRAGQPNYGFLLTFADGAEESSDTDALEFYSRHAGSSYRPYLEITYDTNQAPNAPTGLSPTANALVSTLSPNLTGTHNDPDGDYIGQSQIRVYKDDGTTLMWDQTTSHARGYTTFSRVYAGTALSGNTFYKWQARTADTDGEWGPYSALQRFKVNTAPNPPTLSITESPDSDLDTLTPTLNVTHSDNDINDSKMYGYRIIVQTSGGTAVWDSGDVDTSGAPITTKSIVYSGPSLAWATSYRFQSRTKDSNGVWGAYSAWHAFSTHKTVTPISLDPSGSEVISGLVPTFYAARGSVEDTLTSYQIILYTSLGATQIWDSGSLNTGIYVGSSFSKAYTGTVLQYNTTYQWKARVFSSVGGWSDYSALTTFSTPADVTVPTQSISPVTSGRVTSLTPTFTGSRGSTFTNYQIQLYAESATTATLGTPIWDSGNLSQTAATTVNKAYNGTALAWNTTYKWRIRVGSPTLGTYTGLAAFTTDAASIPTLTAPANNSWITSTTPTFTGTSGNGESITAVRIRVYHNGGNTMLWDSGDLSQTASTSFSKIYTGPTLTGGVTYLWEARYTKSTGPTGPYSTKFAFRLNGAPLIPTQLFPTPGYAFAGSLFPTFRAQFDDPDESSHGDTPTSWVIEIRNNATDALIQTKTLTSGLTNGVNEYVWGTSTGGSDTGLAYNTVYKWRTWFVDSKSAVGTASSYQTFSNAQPPTASIVSPSNGSNINTTKPTITWSYSDPGSLLQSKYSVKIYRMANDTLVYSSGTKVSTLQSFYIPTGYLTRNGEQYTITLQVWNSANLSSDISSATIELQLDAPPAIEGLSATVFEDQSKILLEWDRTSLSTNFVTYIIYRRNIGETEWSMVGVRKPEINNYFNDWYAGQGINYEYRVTVVKLISGEPDLESPDSDIVQARLSADVWFVVGKDRADAHIFELPVVDESHSRPVQQEEFENLGTNRKVIVRGFVLGHEGSLDLMWQPDEAHDAKEKIEYLLYYAGPHILKNPFGGVYDVTFGSPDFQYRGGGTLSTTITWTETGATNNPTITPEQYLASIGAE